MIKKVLTLTLNEKLEKCIVQEASKLGLKKAAYVKSILVQHLIKEGKYEEKTE